MRKCLTIILLVVLTQIGSATAEPPVKPTDIFADGPNVLTSAQLDQLDFFVLFDPKKIKEEAERRERRAKWLSQEEVKQDRKKTDESRQLRHKQLEQSPIAIFMPKTLYRLDEPILAYFAIKNKTDEPLDFDMRLDLQLGYRTANDCRINLSSLTEEGMQQDLLPSQQLSECGGAPSLTLPPKGYYCTRADLRRIGVDRPGIYWISWGHSDLTSQKPRFSVLPAENEEAIEKPVTAIRLAKVSNARIVEQERKTNDTPPMSIKSARSIQSAQLSPLPFRQFAAGLSVNALGNIYPDLQDLPSQDLLVKASLQFEKCPEGKLPRTLILTLTPRQANAGLFIRDGDVENIYLMVSARDEGSAIEVNRKQAQELQMLSQQRLNSLADPMQPLQIRIEMEADWPRHIGLSGPVKMQVILSSEPVKLQRSWPGIGKIVHELHLSNIKPWQGLLCTPAIQINLPAIEKLKKKEPID